MVVILVLIMIVLFLLLFSLLPGERTVMLDDLNEHRLRPRQVSRQVLVITCS